MAAFDEVPAAYIIDGHHRVAATVQRGGEPDSPAGRFLAVAFPDDDLIVYPFHRWVDGELLRPGPPPEERGPTGLEPGPGEAVVVTRAGEWTIDLGAGPGEEDVSALARTVLGPRLGVADERTDPRIKFVPGFPDAERAPGDGGRARRSRFPPSSSHGRGGDGRLRPRRGDAAQGDLLRPQAPLWPLPRQALEPMTINPRPRVVFVVQRPKRPQSGRIEPMPRYLTVAAAQMGPVARDDTREEVVERLLALLDDAHSRGAELVVFPELALTTFFPRYFIEDEQEILTWFEPEMPGPATKPLFDQARRLGVGFSLGYAELSIDDDGVTHRHNTQILVERGRDRRRAIPKGPHPRARAQRALEAVPARRAPLLRAGHRVPGLESL